MALKLRFPSLNLHFTQLFKRLCETCQNNMPCHTVPSLMGRPAWPLLGFVRKRYVRKMRNLTRVSYSKLSFKK